MNHAAVPAITNPEPVVSFCGLTVHWVAGEGLYDMGRTMQPGQVWGYGTWAVQQGCTRVTMLATVTFLPTKQARAKTGVPNPYNSKTRLNLV
jgi:hypothetical protein